MSSKTERYYMETYMLGHKMSKRMQISKKEYLAQIDFLNKEYENDSDDECPMEYYEENVERETIIENRKRWSRGVCDTELIKVTCKPGYQFIKRLG